MLYVSANSTDGLKQHTKKTKHQQQQMLKYSLLCTLQTEITDSLTYSDSVVVTLVTNHWLLVACVKLSQWDWDVSDQCEWIKFLNWLYFHFLIFPFLFKQNDLSNWFLDSYLAKLFLSRFWTSTIDLNLKSNSAHNISTKWLGCNSTHFPF